jgi:hypothetical protein
VFLTNSVDNATKRILANEEQAYTSSGQPCGVTYLKLLIQKVKVDTRTTASHVRRLLTQLDVYMVRESKNNIIKFNECVSNQMNTLASRGETSNDIITNLLTGYMAYTDKNLLSIRKNAKTVMNKVKTLLTKRLCQRQKGNTKPE